MSQSLSKNDRVQIDLVDPEADVDGDYHGEEGTVLTKFEDDLDTGDPADRINAKIDPDRDDLEPRWFRGSELKRKE
jgi:hypothetical protein